MNQLLPHMTLYRLFINLLDHINHHFAGIVEKKAGAELGQTQPQMGLNYDLEVADLLLGPPKESLLCSLLD